MRRTTKKIFIYTTSVVLLFVVIFTVVLYSYLTYSVFGSTKKQCFLVRPGERFQEFTYTLQQQANLPLPALFKLIVKLSGKSKQLKAGEYCFDHDSSTVLDIIQSVTRGNFYHRKLTVISGKTYYDLKQEILSSPGFKHKLHILTQQQLAYILKLPRVEFEGEFLPETYEYSYPESDVDLLIEAHNLLLVKLYQAWSNRDKNLPYKTPYEALIAASIIEKESAIPSDRKLISGVIVNRLRKHMRLQMDPTVLYGLRKRAEQAGLSNQQIILTRQAMRTDTPYNTYLHWGLPPTPICMPSAEAIDAALHPSETEYLYFVAKGNGYHQFSNNLVEQKAAIREYILKIK